MADLESMVPIVVEHNYADRPIGIVKMEDGVIKFKLNDKALLTETDVNTMNRVFSPAYQVTKVDEQGFVRELELVAVGLVVKHP